MKYEWDEHKRRANIQKHGVDFNIVERFDWEMAKVLMDERFHYDEARFVAYSFIANKIHCLVFTP